MAPEQPRQIRDHRRAHQLTHLLIHLPNLPLVPPLLHPRSLSKLLLGHQIPRLLLKLPVVYVRSSQSVAGVRSRVHPWLTLHILLVLGPPGPLTMSEKQQHLRRLHKTPPQGLEQARPTTHPLINLDCSHPARLPLRHCLSDLGSLGVRFPRPILLIPTTHVRALQSLAPAHPPPITAMALE